jgi:CRISPR-associated protein Csx3
MSTFNINLSGNNLLVDIGEAADNDRIVVDAVARLEELIASGELSGGNLLKINGRATVPVSHAIATKIAHLYGAIAVFDPKLRFEGKDRYVVSISHNSDYKLGDLLEAVDSENAIVVPGKANTVTGETSFFVNLEKDKSDDVLQVDFNRLEQVDNDRIVKDAEICLDAKIASGEIAGGSLLKINGPASLPVCYTISHKVSHLYKAIAVFDPKMDRYVVTNTHNAKYKLGDTLNFCSEGGHKRMRVVLCGPANSGKSCLRQGLKDAISRLNTKKIYPYVITAQPDGDGCFTFETYKCDPKYGDETKRLLKKPFTPEFVSLVSGWVRNASLPLSLVDVGGKASDENRIIMGAATHAVIISNSEEGILEWRKFCQSLKPNPLEIIAEIHSDLTGVEDRLESEAPVLKGSIHAIARGVDISQRPTVIALAKLLVSMATSS